MLLPCSIYSFRNRALSSPPYHLMAPISGGKSVRSSSHHLFETKMGTLSTRACKTAEDSSVSMPSNPSQYFQILQNHFLSPNSEIFLRKVFTFVSPLCLGAHWREEIPQKIKTISSHKIFTVFHSSILFRCWIPRTKHHYNTQNTFFCTLIFCCTLPAKSLRLLTKKL